MPLNDKIGNFHSLNKNIERNKKVKLSAKELKKLAKAIKDLKLKTEDSKKTKNPKKIIEENKFIDSSIELEDFSPVLKKLKAFQESSDLEKIASSAPLQENPEDKQENFYSLKQEKKDEKYHQIQEDYLPKSNQRLQNESKNLIHFGESRLKEELQNESKNLMHAGESRPKDGFSEQVPKYIAKSKRAYTPR